MFHKCVVGSVYWLSFSSISSPPSLPSTTEDPPVKQNDPSKVFRGRENAPPRLTREEGKSVVRWGTRGTRRWNEKRVEELVRIVYRGTPERTDNKGEGSLCQPHQ